MKTTSTPLIFKKAYCVASAQVYLDRPPPGLAFLSGVCSKHNLDHDICDLNLKALEILTEDQYARLAEVTPFYPLTDADAIDLINTVIDPVCVDIKNSGADLIMLTVLTYHQNVWAEQFLKRLKHYNIQATIIVGGSGIAVPQTDGQSWARHRADEGLIDYYVLGEGDQVLDEFLKGNTALGINSKDAKTDSWALQVEDLDQTPVPSYGKFVLKEYQRLEQGTGISLTGSRGCVRRCTFCDVGHYWKKFRFRNGKSIAEEIEKHYLETGSLSYFFTDSLINGSLKMFHDMMEHIIKIRQKHNGMPGLKINGQYIVRPKQFHKEEHYRLMRDSGVIELDTGIESGSDRVREHMGKKFSNEDIDYHMEMCSKYGIMNNLLMLVAYPTETRKDFEDTINMIKKYQKYHIDGTVVDVSESLPLILLKNTPLYDMVDELGITGHDRDEYNNLTYDIKSNPELDIKERFSRYIEFQKTLINLNYQRPGRVPIHLEEMTKVIKRFSEEKIKNVRT